MTQKMVFGNIGGGIVTTNMFKRLMISLLLLTLLVLTGCTEPSVTGNITLNPEKKVMKNGETITMGVTGENTGDLAALTELRIIPEDATKLIIKYPGSLETVLQPEESITKIITIQGFTDYSSTSYLLKGILINKDTGKVLDESQIHLTVRK